MTIDDTKYIHLSNPNSCRFMPCAQSDVPVRAGLFSSIEIDQKSLREPKHNPRPRYSGLRMNRLYVNMTTGLYNALLAKGGDDLVAFYVVVRQAAKVVSRNGVFKAHQSRNGRWLRHKSLVRKYTPLSKSVIDKHLPSLRDLGVVKLNESGDLWVMGSYKCHEMYPGKKNARKEIKINSHSYQYAKDYSKRLRIASSYTRQQKQAEKKRDRKRTLRLLEKDLIFDLSTIKRARSFAKRVERSPSLIKDYSSRPILSLLGFARIIKGADYHQIGNYWKRKMIKLGFVKTRRNFQRYAQFDTHKTAYKYIKRMMSMEPGLILKLSKQTPGLVFVECASFLTVVPDGCNFSCHAYQFLKKQRDYVNPVNPIPRFGNYPLQDTVKSTVTVTDYTTGVLLCKSNLVVKKNIHGE